MPRILKPLIDEEVSGPLEPDRFKLPNPSGIQPLYHGDGCVGLSGLYSMINGIRLVLADRCDFDGPAVHSLLTTGLRFMDGRLTPTRATTSGLRVGMWKQLAEAMTEHTRQRHRVLIFAERIHVGPGVDRTEALSLIEQNIRAYRAVLLLMGGGRYTVINGYTPSSLLLFDSAWSSWISKRITDVPTDGERGRHVIYPSSLLALRA